MIMVPPRVAKIWGRIRRAALLAVATLALLGCESSNDKRSFDLGYGEDAPVYLDELSADQRDAAAASITAGLSAAPSPIRCARATISRCCTSSTTGSFVPIASRWAMSWNSISSSTAR